MGSKVKRFRGSEVQRFRGLENIDTVKGSLSYVSIFETNND